MTRTVTITAPPDKTPEILHALQEDYGLLDLQLYAGASVVPPGDVIKAVVPNARLNDLIGMLDAHGLGQRQGLSVSTSKVAGYVPTGSGRSIERDNNPGTWEEMVMTINDDSATSTNTLMLIFISGALAAIGLATNSLHIVIGGMLVAPGFMPITRIAVGIVGRHSTWRYGCVDTVTGYIALMTGAAVTSLALEALGYAPLSGSASYYVTSKALIDYWTTFTWPSVMASAVASVAGALLVATQRSVFSSGVMIGLALVPAAAIVSMSLVQGNWALAGEALLRFGADVALVLLLSLLTLLWVRFQFHNRNVML
jgi:hypothetical protein